MVPPDPNIPLSWNTLVQVCTILGVGWGGFRWLVKQMDERWKAHVESDEFNERLERKITASVKNAFDAQIERGIMGQLTELRGITSSHEGMIKALIARQHGQREETS